MTLSKGVDPKAGGDGREAPIMRALREAGDVGHDLLAVDWSTTPLGEPEGWPQSLVTIVRVVLTSRFAMWMAWGADLTFFCNDAYRRETLGTKYPWALGRPAREVWAEIWEDIGPRIETVLSTGTATWDESLMLFLERSGYPEETYHTFSYSPLTDDAGAIAGMLCVVSEETERVIGERRMATLRDLGSESTAGRDDREYLRAATQHLSANESSLPFTLVYLFDEAGGTAELACSTGFDAGAHPAAPVTIAADDPDPAWPIRELMDGRMALVERIDQRFSELPTGAWDEPPRTAVVLPLPQPVQPSPPYGCLVIGANRYRPLDDSYLSFFALIAAQLASGIAGARAYEAERLRAEQLAELDRAKTAFFTNVSHELRTPLTLLLGPAEDALAAGPEALPAPQRRSMEIIARNGARLLRLVNTLLEFSRVESGRATAIFERTDLSEYTAELASMFESAVTRAGLDFRLERQPLPEPVFVDREMWAKIVLNLLSNALKFTLEGEITVRIEDLGGFARLSVSDTGIGIDPEQQPKLFERFHRVPGARGRTHEGSGIGLAFVAELAHLHGGTVGVQSTPGAGSTFTISLPYGSEHLPPEQIGEPEHEVSVEREIQGFLDEARRWLSTPDLRADPIEPGGAGAPDGRTRVLVADDNADMRDYVTGLLAEHYSVQAAADGEEALRLARTAAPDLVLTDVMMPRLDGFGLLAALRADPDTVDVPVVMLSARAGEEGIIEGLDAGADDYLVKPFSARELLARVRANLELDRVRRARDRLQRSQSVQAEAERLARMGSWEVDLTTGSIHGSDGFRAMLGVSAKQLRELTVEDALTSLLAPDDQDRVRESVRRAISSGEPFEYERRGSSEHGEDERWIRIRGDVVRDELGEPRTVTGFLQDVSQERLAEKAVAAAAAAQETAEREHEIADALQRSLLPPREFESGHLEVASSYQAGVAGTRVGGDWYDVIDLGAGRAALSIGDVAGRGIPAARIMGQLRAAARAYARLDLPPGEVLEMLDAILCELAPDQLATCIYGVYDPVTHELRYANAGHLPPLLAVPGGDTSRLPTAVDPPLGVGAMRYREEGLTLAPGSMLVLYTDGLVERRDRGLDQGIDLLAEHVRPTRGPVASLPDELVRTMAPEGTEDDIAILVARVHEDASQRTAELDVAPDPAALRAGRTFADDTFRKWSIPEELVPDAVLIVSELLTNALLHGEPPIHLRLRRTQHELAIEVRDSGSAMPRKLTTSPQDLHGRGLAIIAGVSARWAARPDGQGKVVWSTLALPNRF